MTLTDEEVKALEIIIPSVFGFFTVLITTIGGIILAKIKGYHRLVNSRMDELIRVTKEAASRQGKEEGIAQEKEDQKNRDKSK